jgi:integrase
MASSWIERRTTAGGRPRYIVKYTLGGRRTRKRYAGSFQTMREATLRCKLIADELAELRVPDVSFRVTDPPKVPTVRQASEAWLASRVDVASNTRGNHQAAVAAIVPIIGERPIDTVTPADVAALVAKLCETRKRETVRKMLVALGMIFDHAGVAPNPARDKIAVKLPFERKAEVNPPTAAHVRAVHDLLPTRYRLPLLVLDATGMRLGELDALTWGDVDEPRGRWRVSQAVSKTKAGRWVNVPPLIFEAVTALVPRDDRTPERPVFQGFGGARFRTAISRACTAAGIPTFSPHDLRHRRISLLHLSGVPWVHIGQHVGQRNLAVTANTYTHVLTDEAELDYERLLNGSGVTG